ncbi:MAG: UDP-N-acetylglucosamine 2-epimerase [Cellvibrionaceae bacterium]
MRELQKRNIDYNFVFSGQHQATIDDIRTEFGVKKPDHILYKGDDITGIFQMLIWMFHILFSVWRNRKEVWKADKDGIVLNHGDTFSTLLGSFCAKICGLKNAHVESGLRSYDLLNPFPEELTRRLTFLLTDVFLAPGDWAINNLTKYSGKKINTEYNTLIDALSASAEAIDSVTIDIPSYQYGIVSIHRFENIFSKKRLLKIIQRLEEISSKHKLLFILHKPTHKNLIKYGLYERLVNNPNIDIHPRYSYFEFIKLVKSASLVVTDGGSNQEECFFLGKPCLIFRQATERQDGINHNAVLSTFSRTTIDQFIDNIEDYRKPPISPEKSPSAIIADNLTTYA